MKKNRFLLVVLCILFFKTESAAQSCGTVYGAGYSGTGSSVGVRAFNFTTNTWNGASLESTTYFTNPNTINKGGPIAIDPINQQINLVTDATNPLRVALFNFGSSPLFVSLPAAFNTLTQLFCSGYYYNTHRCYYLTANLLSSATPPAGQGFVSVDFSNVSAANTVAANTAALITKTYTCSLAPGSPYINTNGGTNIGADLCFDLNGTAYLVTGSKQLYTIVTNESAGTATFTYIASLASLSFVPSAVAFDPANSKLTIGGPTQTVSEYNLSNNTVTQLTTTSGYIAPDFASCFYPNINPALQISKTIYDSTQHIGPGPGTEVNINTNDIVEYTITVTNSGNVNAGGFTVADPIPAGTSYVAGSTRVNGAAIADGAGGTFPFATAKSANSSDQAAGNGILTVYTNASPLHPTSVITYLVKVTSIGTSPVVNTATASITGSSPTTPVTASATATFQVGIILPVTLINFSAYAQNNTVKLNWATNNEVNNNRFEVERSIDGNAYTTIDIIKADETNTAFTHNYSFTDEYPFAGVNYYRLKQVDMNNGYAYSPVHFISFDTRTAQQELRLFPNPAKGQNVMLSTGTGYKKLNVGVLSTLGQRMSEQLFINTGNTVSLNISKLAKGLYYLQIIADDKTLNPLKLIIE